MSNPLYICYFDGACEPKNPGGNMGMGAYLSDKNGEIVKEYSEYVEAHYNNTNNVAEYRALLWILKTLQEVLPDGEMTDITIYGDSQLVIKQMTLRWKIKNGSYVTWASQCLSQLMDLRRKANITIEWVPRDENGYADELSKRELKNNNVDFAIQKHPGSV